MKRALVCGAGGFIGGHLVKRLKAEGYWVRGVDIKEHEFHPSVADEFVLGDLREQSVCRKITCDLRFDELYQLAADMGGAGYIFTCEHEAAVMHNSATINLNMVEEAKNSEDSKVFYSSRLVSTPKRLRWIREPWTTGEDRLPSPSGQRVRLGEALQRASLPLLPAITGSGSHRPLPQCLRPGRDLGGQEKAPAAMCRKVAEQPTPGRSNVGRRRADPDLSLHRRVP